MEGTMLPTSLINKTKDLATPLVISLVGAGGKTSTAFWLAQNYKQLGHKVLMTTTTKMYLPPWQSVDNFISIDALNVPIDAIFKPSSSHFDKSFSSRDRKLNSNQGSKGAISFLYQQQYTDDNGKQKVQGITPSNIAQLKKHAPFTVFIIEADGAKCLPIKCPADHEPNLPQCSDIVICVTSAETMFTPIKPEKINRWREFSHITQCQQGQTLNENLLTQLISHPKGSFKHAPNTSVKIWLINKIDLNHDQQRLIAMAQNINQQQNAINEIWLANMQAKQPIHSVFHKD